VKRIVLLTVLALALASWFVLELGQYANLEAIKQYQSTMAGFYESHPVLVLGAFFLGYVLLTALSFPGAALLTLLAGALFGVVVGTIVVSFASTIGATLAFLAARYLFRDTVQSRFAQRLKAINAGVERDGAFYLFSLRLVPVFPFFAVNLVMGLTPIRIWTYFWVSQVGMLLGTIVYVNAGTQLAGIEDVRDIATPELLLSFAALGLLPWIGKFVMRWIRRGQVYRKWQRPRSFDRNLVVIGAGSAGLVSSYIAATVKAKVTLVEASRMGGDCLNYGCVPSKALVKSAKVAHHMREAQKYGLSAVEPQFSFSAVMDRIHRIIAEIEPHDSVERYTGLGVDVLHGYAGLIDPWTVEVTGGDGNTHRLTTRAVVIAAGAEPFVPDLPGLPDTGYLTSDTLWDEFARLEEIPRRIVVLGGGPIGCELSQAFARLGATVTQVERGTRVLAREDGDVSDLAKDSLEASGATVLTGHEAIGFETEHGEKIAILRSEDGERRIGFDALIVAIGRKARLSGYGLEELGIDTDRTVVTDDYLATLYSNIYAAGDVAGPYQFTHTAAHQAWFASVNALFGQFWRFKADYRVIPWTTFLDPEIARVGLNEQEAAEQGVEHEVTVYPLYELDRAIAESETGGFVKVITPPGKDRILGVTIVGPHAGELLAEYVLAMKHGLGLNKILGTIHTYPTLAEANKFAAGEWKKKHAPERLLAIVARYHRWRRG